MRVAFSTWSFLLLRLLDRTGTAIPSEDLGEPKPCAPGQDCEIDGFVGSRVIFEDEMVRVWNFTLPPGGMTSLHRHDLATWRKKHGMRFFHFRVSMGHKKSAGFQTATSPQLPPMILRDFKRDFAGNFIWRTSSCWLTSHGFTMLHMGMGQRAVLWSCDQSCGPCDPYRTP